MCDFAVFLLALKIPPYLTFFVTKTFFEVKVAIRIYRLEVLCKNWRHFNLEKQGFLDGVCLSKIFTLEPSLCLKVYDGNLGDMLT